MRSKFATIINPTGLHARPASDFVISAGKFESEILIGKLSNPDMKADAKSIIMLLSMGLVQGDEVEITASGADEEEAVNALVGLIESGFGE
jgi:phosphocarrier protein